MDPAAWTRRVVVLLIGVPVAASVLVLIASFVPDRLILDELVGAVERQEIVASPHVGIAGRGLDTFSDCIAVTMGLGETDGSAATIWVRSPTLGSCDGAIASILAYERGEGLAGGYEYFRYWHGYTVVSRPLIALVGVAGERIVLLWGIIASLAGLAWRLSRHHGVAAPAALLVPWLLTTDTVELARSVPYGCGTIVSVLGAWGIHVVATRQGDERVLDLRLVTAAFLGGAAFVFVDVLTTPPGAWALATAMGVLASTARFAGPRLLLRGAVVAGAWISGWVWTWMSKWAIAALFLGVDRVRDNVRGAVEDRLSGERDYIELAPFNAIDANVQQWLDHPLTWPVIAGVLAVTVVRWRRGLPDRGWDRVVLALPAVFPFVWYEVLRNHSLVHPGLTYRSLGVTAGVVALALLVALPVTRPGARFSSSAPVQPEHAEHER